MRFGTLSRILAISMVAGAGYAAAARASSVNGAKITSVRADITGVGLIAIDKTVAGPACSGNKSIFAFDTNTPGGRSMLTIATAAQLSGRLVEFQGPNTCLAGFEQLTYLNMQ